LRRTPEGKYILKILLVEDEDSARIALGRIMENSGHEVVSAVDGPEGLKHFDEQGDFDIVLTDLGLPGPSGWEVAKSVKKKSRNTPVVLLSGWDIDEDDKEIQESGVDRVLAKPVRVKDILQVVEDLVIKKVEG